MNDLKQHILVYSGSFESVEKLKYDLEEADISVLIKNSAIIQTITGYTDKSYVRLYILESEIEKATPIVARFKERFKL